MDEKPKFTFARYCLFAEIEVEVHHFQLVLLKKPKNERVWFHKFPEHRNCFQLAREIGVLPDELDPYGKKKAKVSLDVLKRLQHVKDGKYIVVAGELSLFSFE